MKRGFTLIEVMVVLILISIVYFLVIRNYTIHSHKIIKLSQLYELTPKNCKIFFFKHKNNKFDIKLVNPKIFTIIDNNLKQIYFNDYNGSKVVFEYIKHNGIQNSYILQNTNEVFIFTPFSISKVKNLDIAKIKILNQKLLPFDGRFYK